MSTLTGDSTFFGDSIHSLWQRLAGRRATVFEPAAAVTVPKLTITRHDEIESDAVTLYFSGEFDATSYEDAIDVAQNAYCDGCRNIILDFSDVTRVTTSAFYALTSITLTFNGDALLDAEYGWDALHKSNQVIQEQTQQHAVIVSPSPAVAIRLRSNGFSDFLPVVGSHSEALALVSNN